MIPLTKRELDAVRNTAAGMSYKESAKALGVSPHTLKDHLKVARAKMGVKNGIQLAVKASQKGLLR